LSATSQSVDASTGSAGQIGDSSNRPDVFADRVDTTTLEATNTATASGYVDETPNRSANTTFTNNTDGDLEVKIIMADDAGDINAELNVDGTRTAYASGRNDEAFRTLSATVPKGSDYKLTPFSGTLDTWLEQGL